MKIVLDANQFVSAVLVPVGHPAQILSAWRRGDFDLVISPQIIEEVRRVLFYPRLMKKHKMNEAEVDEFLLGLKTAAIISPGNLEVKIIKDDPTDDKYVACALEIGAEYIVSGDDHLKNLGEYQGVKIISPVQFLRDVFGQDLENTE
jgi:putative PIN family toxin of toxin-antitoxin system